MPMYVYTTRDGEQVERRFKMSEYPQCITLPDGRIATLTIQAHARMANNWAVQGIASDLPAESAPYMGPSE
jgi:hypothetical protein